MLKNCAIVTKNFFSVKSKFHIEYEKKKEFPNIVVPLKITNQSSVPVCVDASFF